jgi:alanyl-tRNA synthetase
MSAKEELRRKFSREPDRYYNVQLFKDLGFVRKKCTKCGKYFWTLSERETCPDTTCQKYEFIGDPPTKVKLDYVGVWKAVERFFEQNGHRSVSSYPVICRWFPGLFFTIASITAFQRKKGGETVFEFPYNPLVVPQVCLRFSDIPNVGVSGRHHTSFVMIGQHSLYNPATKEGYWKDRCVELDFKLLTDVFKIPQEEISFLEDVWVGPNAFGYSLEYFVRGLELGNAVFTEFLGTPSEYTTMDRKVIDMGAGLERFAWLLNGADTSYDTAFGPVVEKLKSKISYDAELFMKYAKISGSLNMDETSNIRAAKLHVANQLGISVEKLKTSIEPIEALYAICDHSKTLLYALGDGLLPSNAGGGYNLRIILRRALGFIDEFDLDIDLYEVCKTHASYLKKMDPRVKENLPDIKEILDVEKKRFDESGHRAAKTIEMIIEKKTLLSNEKLLELYDSHGITPELIEEAAKKKNIRIEIPEDFYSKISEKHIAERIEEKELKINVKDLPKTRFLFYEDVKRREFSAKVLRIIDRKYVVLDQTCFYPRSGGQEPDTGIIEESKVYEVEKIGDVVVHFVENPTFSEGDIVKGAVDWKRREQLSKHHTATHIINAASRQILGNHIWQHSAFKDVDKARLDITHYETPDDKQIAAIEKLANKIVKNVLVVRKTIMPRMEAEKKFGFRIYQGGAVPESELRIVELVSKNKAIDVEACGGLHRSTTKDIGEIMILKVERIQDGIIRLIFTAGDATKAAKSEEKKLIAECKKILRVSEKKLLPETKRLFSEWKKLNKEIRARKAGLAKAGAKKLDKKFINNVLIEKIPGADIEGLQEISKILSSDDRILILFGVADKVYVFGSAGKNTGVNMENVVRDLCQKLKGGGGGSPFLGQGVCYDFAGLDNAIKELKKELM